MNKVLEKIKSEAKTEVLHVATLESSSFTLYLSDIQYGQNQSPSGTETKPTQWG